MTDICCIADPASLHSRLDHSVIRHESDALWEAHKVLQALSRPTPAQHLARVAIADELVRRLDLSDQVDALVSDSAWREASWHDILVEAYRRTLDTCPSPSTTTPQSALTPPMNVVPATEVDVF